MLNRFMLMLLLSSMCKMKFYAILSMSLVDIMCFSCNFYLLCMAVSIYFKAGTSTSFTSLPRVELNLSLLISTTPFLELS